jgi:polar amino acid transport system substrate-binding protein
MRMSHIRICSTIAKVYIDVMRGTPVLVLLMMMCYVAFTKFDNTPVAIITFAMNFAGYVSEMFRTSINSIDKGQTEAGIAMGFTPAGTFFNFIAPQAIRRVLPVYKGELISLIKNTSIVGYVAVADLTRASYIIRGRTFDPFFPLIMVALMYFALAWLFTKGLDMLGNKINAEIAEKE